MGAVVILALSGCGGVREEFLGVRVEDACGGEWPICSSEVGCILGDRSYVEGRFPGENRVAIQIFEPSTVTVSFFLFEVGASGTELALNFHEDACRARTRVTASGKTFLAEAEKRGFASREADLSGVGDHLIEWSSDARAKYYAKIDVLPLRLKEAAGSR